MRRPFSLEYGKRCRVSSQEGINSLRLGGDRRSIGGLTRIRSADMIFKIGDVDIRKYGSQGQQRTSALSLKLAEIQLVKDVINDTPILLLDDVLSELDSNRQNYLLNSIHDIQTVISCTGLDEFVKNRFKINKIFKVVEGKVISEN